MLDRWFYPAWRQRFRRDLAAAGLSFVAIENQVESWSGNLEVSWDDPVTGAYMSASHRILVVLTPAFPFAKPEVFPFDIASPIRDGVHQLPGMDNGPLCLWPSEDTGWLPHMTADDLLERTRTWLIHHHRHDWRDDNRPPDLHLYFPTDSRRSLMLTGLDWPPPDGSLVGRFGIWRKDAYRAFAGAPTVGLSMPLTVHTDRILPILGLAERRVDMVGVWFRLLREPQPQMKLDELLRELDMAADQQSGWALNYLQGLIGSKVRPPKDIAMIAVGYPGSDGIEQWLFLQTRLSKDEAPTHWAHERALRNISVESFETAPADRQALMRRTHHTATQLTAKSVLIFGQGAIGSAITLLLAKSGVEQLRIVDRARLRPGNAVRHVGGLGLVGYKKHLVTKIETELHVPDCVVTVEDTTWDAQLITQWARAADIVVDATANRAFSLLLNEICVRGRRPIVFVAGYRRAAIGRIRITRSREDACLACYESGYWHNNNYPRIPLGDEGAFVESGCGIPTVEASAVDTEAIANWTARSVLWFFQGKLGRDNHCLVVNDTLPDISGNLAKVGVHWTSWPPLPNCEVCGRDEYSHDNRSDS